MSDLTAESEKLMGDIADLQDARLDVAYRWLHDALAAIEAAAAARATAPLLAERDALRSALRAIADHEPEEVPLPDPHPADCPECKRYEGHPIMQGSCDEAHRVTRRYLRSIEDRRHAEQYDMRRIARAALTPPAPAASGERCGYRFTSGEVCESEPEHPRHFHRPGDACEDEDGTCSRDFAYCHPFHPAEPEGGAA